MTYNSLENIVIQKYDAYLRGKHYIITKKFDRNATKEYDDMQERSSRWLDQYIQKSKAGFLHSMDDMDSDLLIDTSSVLYKNMVRSYEGVVNETINSMVKIIRDITNNDDDRARIAVNVVQNIPYDYDQYESLEHNGPNGRSQYGSYEVLLHKKGICNEKSILIMNLLRGLGFGAGTFYLEKENHRAAAIKVKGPGYRNTGYAFIESTTPSIIGYNPSDDNGINNPRELINNIGGGKSFDNSEELEDVKRFNRTQGINDIHEMWKKYQPHIPTEKNVLEGINYKG